MKLYNNRCITNIFAATTHYSSLILFESYMEFVTQVTLHICSDSKLGFYVTLLDVPFIISYLLHKTRHSELVAGSTNVEGAPGDFYFVFVYILCSKDLSKLFQTALT